MQDALHVERILLVRLGALGDVVLTLPAVHLVRTAFPEARLAFLIYKEFAPLLEGFPGINTVLTLDRARYRGLNPLTICADTLSLLRNVARGRFDLVVDFQGFGETGWLSWLSRAPQRWGSVYRPSRKWAYTRPVWRNQKLHPVEYHLDVLRLGGSLTADRIRNEFMVPPAALDEARRIFLQANLDPNRRTLFIQPFTSAPHKNWPLDSYLALARQWRNAQVQVLFGGGPGDRAALEPVRQAGFAVAAGAPLLVSASLASLSTVVLGGETGLLHLAVSMGKRVIMIMGFVGPGAGYPFGHEEWALIPSTGSAVATITFEAVNRACSTALNEVAGKM